MKELYKKLGAERGVRRQPVIAYQGHVGLDR